MRDTAHIKSGPLLESVESKTRVEELSIHHSIQVSRTHLCAYKPMTAPMAPIAHASASVTTAHDAVMDT